MAVVESWSQSQRIRRPYLDGQQKYCNDHQVRCHLEEYVIANTVVRNMYVKSLFPSLKWTFPGGVSSYEDFPEQREAHIWKLH